MQTLHIYQQNHNNFESTELLECYVMSYFWDSSAPDEGNLVVLPSRLGNKRSRIESELPGKAENETKKRTMMEYYWYQQSTTESQSHECDNFHPNIISNSNDSKSEPKSSDSHSPASTSTTSRESSVLQHKHQLSSQHKPIQQCNPANPRIELPKFKPFTNFQIHSSPPQCLEQPKSTSRHFLLELEPTLLAPAMSPPIGLSLKLDSELSSSHTSSKATFNSDMDVKHFRHRATTNNGLSLSLGSSSKFDIKNKSAQLSRQSTFKSTASSKIYTSKAEPYGSSMSNNLSLKIEPEFLPSNQLPRRPTFRSTIDSVIKLLVNNGEELDTQLSLGSSRTSSKAASSSNVDRHASQGIDTRTTRGCTSSILKLEIPPNQLITPEIHTTSSITKLGIPPSQSITYKRKSTPIISKLGIPPLQLKTSMKHALEQKIELLRQQTKSTTATIDAVRREALTRTRIENLRRERILKEHLKRNKISNTKAEDLLSQSLRMGRFPVQSAETREFQVKRSRESSWSNNQIKEDTSRRSFGEENVWSENSRTRYVSSRGSRREAPTSESWWSKNLLASTEKNLTEDDSVTSQGIKLPFFRSGTRMGELRHVPSSKGIEQMEKDKEVELIKSVSEKLGLSLQWSRPNIQQPGWSPGEIDLSLGLQMPSTSFSQVAENPDHYVCSLMPQFDALENDALSSLHTT